MAEKKKMRGSMGGGNGGRRIGIEGGGEFILKKERGWTQEGDTKEEGRGEVGRERDRTRGILEKNKGKELGREGRGQGGRERDREEGHERRRKGKVGDTREEGRERERGGGGE